MNPDDVMLRKQEPPDRPCEDWRPGRVPELAQQEHGLAFPDPCPYLTVGVKRGKPTIEIGIKGTF